MCHKLVAQNLVEKCNVKDIKEGKLNRVSLLLAVIFVWFSLPFASLKKGANILQFITSGCLMAMQIKKLNGKHEMNAENNRKFCKAFIH